DLFLRFRNRPAPREMERGDQRDTVEQPENALGRSYIQLSTRTALQAVCRLPLQVGGELESDSSNAIVVESNRPVNKFAGAGYLEKTIVVWCRNAKFLAECKRVCDFPDDRVRHQKQIPNRLCGKYFHFTLYL